MFLQVKRVSQRVNCTIEVRLCKSRALSKLLSLMCKEKMGLIKEKNVDELINMMVGTKGMEKN